MTQPAVIPTMRIYRSKTFALTVREFTVRDLHMLVKEPPHRHDLHEIFLVTEGSSQQTIDDMVHHFTVTTLGLISKGQVHNILTMSEFKIWAIFFDVDVLDKNLHKLCLSLFNLHSQNQFFLSQTETELLEAIFNAMRLVQSNKAESYARADLLQYYLGALLWHIERIKRKSYQASKGKLEHYETCQTFLRLLEASYASEHSVRFYADSLGLSTRQLSYLTKAALGKRAKDLIEERLRLEAQRLLRYSDLSVQAIGYKLGFEDPAYFARFFKRQTKFSPTSFRSSGISET